MKPLHASPSPIAWHNTRVITPNSISQLVCGPDAVCSFMLTHAPASHTKALHFDSHMHVPPVFRIESVYDSRSHDPFLSLFEPSVRFHRTCGIAPARSLRRCILHGAAWVPQPYLSLTSMLPPSHRLRPSAASGTVKIVFTSSIGNASVLLFIRMFSKVFVGRHTISVNAPCVSHCTEAYGSRQASPWACRCMFYWR